VFFLRLRVTAEAPRAAPAASACRSAGALCAAAEAFPLGAPSDAGLHAALEELRARFRAAAAQLGVAQAYAPGRGGAPGAFAAPGLAGGLLPPEGAPASRDLSF
jgi:hypothetical protein